MGSLRRFSDRLCDRLFAGGVPDDDRELEQLATFVRDVKSRLGQPPTDETARRHVAAMVAAAHAGEESDVGAREPAAEGAARRDPRPVRLRQRRKPMFSHPLRVKLLILAVCLLLVAFATAAYAGALPGSLQGPVSDAAGTVGIDVPDDDEDDADADDQSEDLLDDADDQGEDLDDADDLEDDQGEDSDAADDLEDDEGEDSDDADDLEDDEGEDRDDADDDADDSHDSGDDSEDSDDAGDRDDEGDADGGDD